LSREDAGNTDFFFASKSVVQARGDEVLNLIGTMKIKREMVFSQTLQATAITLI
jgi:hypothetical protein